MNEVGAALQFFYGFGENWNALDELLSEMDEWLPGTSYVIVVEHAEELFADDPTQFERFVPLLQFVGGIWSTPVEGNQSYDRPALPFHVVFETTNAAAIESRIVATGVDFARYGGSL